MRRRAIGLGLLGLGAFALVAALLVRLVLVDTLVRLPLDQTGEASGKGTDVSFFDSSVLEQREGLEADVKQLVQGDPDSDDAGDDVAVWSYGSTIYDENGDLLNAGTYRVCIDRHTAVAVDCESDYIDYDEDKSVEGLTVTFPFDTQKHDYDVFNMTTGQAWPATFEGVEDIEDLEVYKFVQVVPETVVREIEVPGSLVGSDVAMVDAEVVYNNERTMWVEPRSGVIVTASETPYTVLRGPDGQEGPVVLAGEFAGTEDTVADGVARAEDTAGQINLLKNIVPLLLLVFGILAVVVGLLLTLSANRRARGRHEAQDADDQEPAKVS
jgi:hypothetical protein